MHRFYIVFIWWLFFYGSFAQVQLPGEPFSVNFTAKQYNASSQNWAITQDARGIIYVANHSYVLEYDGSQWRQILVKLNAPIRSLGVDSAGKVYVGAAGELGYLASDKTGKQSFVSWLPKIPEKNRDFADVWQTYATNQGVFFSTDKYLFHFLGDSCTVFQAQESFHFSFWVNGRLLIRERGRGLLEFKNNQLNLVPLGERFADERIYTILPLNTTELLIGTREKGLYRYTGRELIPFDPTLNSSIVENLLYHGVKLTEDLFAFATLRSGVIIINQQGKIIKQLGKSTGLLDDMALFLYKDQSQALWIAWNNGLSRVEYPSPFSRISEINGLVGIPLIVFPRQEMVYVGTSTGLFRFDKSTQQTFLEPVKGIQSECWDIKEQDGKIYAATLEGVFEVNSKKATLIYDCRAQCVLPSKYFSGDIWVGLESGVLRLTRRQNHWVADATLPNITEKVRNMVETKYGELLIGTDYQGIIIIPIAQNKPVSRITTQNGLPDGEYYLFSAENTGVIATQQGLFTISDTGKLIPDNRFGNKFLLGQKKKNPIFNLYEDFKGDVWIDGHEGIGVVRKSQKAIEFEELDLKRLPTFNILDIAVSQDNVVWFSGADGIICYRIQNKNLYNPVYRAIIRSVTLSGVDSTIYFGAKNNWTHTDFLPYRYNAIRFEYSVPAFTNSPHNQYQYFLEGFDSAFSNWTYETKKDYTNLPEGSFRFHVRARDTFEQLSRESVFEFVILPPWYRRWWAYLLYTTCGILTIVGFIQWRTHKIQVEKIALERKVAERTQEVLQQKEEIERKNKALTNSYTEINKQKTELEKANVKIKIQNETLISANEEIEKHNKDMMDSIRYALRIQEAILPRKNVLAQFLDDYFIFFKPRDIVSGDFYWFTALDNGNKIVLAAADCTGHGVPGAFMSLIGYTMLNKLIIERGLTDPGEILTKLNDEVVTALRQQQNNDSQTTMDGMDIALFIYEKPTRFLSYAGANRPLWLFEEANLIEIKPEKQPIGGNRPLKQPFITKTKTIKPNTSIYITSDGFADQFGGEFGRKFMTKRLLEILTSQQQYPLAEQEKNIQNIFQKWMEGYSQIDDILIIGVKMT
ncbi:MAG: SpoIIE family protein phosphatase [Bacteroidia bacterium]|nr:SpoIIE family protein phosphatase [Bacteroidia bacterium]